MKAVYIVQRTSPSEKVVLVEDNELNLFIQNLNWDAITRVAVYTPEYHSSAPVHPEG